MAVPASVPPPISPSSTTTDDYRLAELSRPRREFKETLRGKAKVTSSKKCGRKRQHFAKDSVKMNWMTPFVHRQVNQVIQKVGYPYSPKEIVRRLRILDPALYSRLRPQRISAWRDRSVTSSFKWRDSILAAATKGNAPGGVVNRSHIFVCSVFLHDSSHWTHDDE